ncbi:DUF397 domain-containing protein [Nocardia jejuensis]|uniref:DUF397 domain-containing protein n=1 Tax=Nocardia jejuensis TaxID=328049 RepID=UPI00082BDC4B|nr:DUF397 domain-containing protein [Nocardia jejuensis]
MKLSEADWFKSSHSSSGGDCVEAAHASEGRIGVRDSKLGDASPVLCFEPAQWDVFMGAIGQGEFDLP